MSLSALAHLTNTYQVRTYYRLFGRYMILENQPLVKDAIDLGTKFDLKKLFLC